MIHGLTLFFQITIRFQTLHACDKHLRELKRCFGVFGSNIGIHNPRFSPGEKIFWTRPNGVYAQILLIHLTASLALHFMAFFFILNKWSFGKMCMHGTLVGLKIRKRRQKVSKQYIFL